MPAPALPEPGMRPPSSVLPAAAKRERQRAIRELVARQSIGSQHELVEALLGRNMAVTQATVSRDIAEMGLVKIWRGDRQAYVAPEDLGPAQPPSSDDLLRRLLRDIPVTVGRSGLSLVLVGPPGTANTIAQAIDQSSLSEQLGTLAGDNTLLVLFSDDARLERWFARFRLLQGLPGRASEPEVAEHAGAPVLTSSGRPSPLTRQEVSR
jgi:transcriptional regulator of arginine metabolism